MTQSSSHEPPPPPETPSAALGSPASSPAHWYWLISLPFAGFLLYWSLRGVDWTQLWATLRSARLSIVALLFPLGTVTLFLRSLRWRTLLRAGAPVDVPTAFWATCAGYFGNSFLPARAGEVVRTMLVSSRSDLAKTYVLTTALTERAVDGIALVTISAIALLSVPDPPAWLARAARPFAILGFIAALAIAVLPRLERFSKYLIARAPVSERIQHRFLTLLEQVQLGMRSLHQPSRLIVFIAFTALIWLIDAMGTILGGRALGIGMTLPVACLLIAGLGLGSALPSTPGYVGIYQFVAVSVLTPFGVSRSNAIAYIIFAQMLQYALYGFWGLLSLWHFRSTARRSRTASP